MPNVLLLLRAPRLRQLNLSTFFRVENVDKFSVPLGPCWATLAPHSGAKSR